MSYYFSIIPSANSNLPHFLSRITKKVAAGVHQGVTTVELDNLAAETAAYLTTKHPDYAILAARIAISNLHKETKKTFSAVIHDLYTMSRSRRDLLRIEIRG